jgi:hypothetical protein
MREMHQRASLPAGRRRTERRNVDLRPRHGRLGAQGAEQSPPGVCCAQQNVFDPVGGRFLRFPAFSGSHGRQWLREIYLSNSSLWSYDLASNTWRDLRPTSVDRAQVAADRDTGRSRGFGFVEMKDGGDEAIAAVHGAEFQGRSLKVNEAKPHEQRPRAGSGYGRHY